MSPPAHEKERQKERSAKRIWRARRPGARRGAVAPGRGAFLGARKWLPLPGPVHVRVRVQVVSGSLQGYPRAAPDTLHEGTLEPPAGVAQQVNVAGRLEALGRCEDSSLWLEELGGPQRKANNIGVANTWYGVPTGSKSMQENLPYEVTRYIYMRCCERMPWQAHPHRTYAALEQRCPKMFVVTEVVFTFWRGLD